MAVVLFLYMTEIRAGNCLNMWQTQIRPQKLKSNIHPCKAHRRQKTHLRNTSSDGVFWLHSVHVKVAWGVHVMVTLTSNVAQGKDSSSCRLGGPQH